MKWKNLNSPYRSRLEELSSMDPYALLEIERGATDETIKSAYRKKTRAYHPDVSDEFVKGYNEEVIKLINVAYQAITRERSRKP